MATATAAVRASGINLGRAARRYGWTIAVYALFVLLMVITVIIKPDYGTFEWNTLTLAALPLAFAATAETMVVLGGGIDLSVGPLMAVANVLALRGMVGHDLQYSLLVSLGVLALVTAAGALNGVLIVITRVPDIVITLATSFVWAGVALLVLAKPTPGIPFDYQNLAQGSALSPWIPNALLLLLVIPLVWIPLRRSRAGLSIYAVGSDRNAAFRSGVNLGVSRIIAYAVGGFFAACGGLALSMTTGVGTPLAGTLYTLSAVSAIVLGGV
ncbi:MAG TPA: ABC transporter permease, partial [Candidatus Dormibacteraeota bacterium]|nr:ABC transporter permease [Candidatus Dormibacteraeota bacterium]